jgi:hypothetical protein
MAVDTADPGDQRLADCPNRLQQHQAGSIQPPRLLLDA